MSGGSNPDKCLHFFKTLITSSAAVTESGQRNSQLRKSIFPRSKKNLASELTPNGFYGNLKSVCSACVFCVRRVLFSRHCNNIPLCVNPTTKHTVALCQYMPVDLSPDICRTLYWNTAGVQIFVGLW